MKDNDNTISPPEKDNIESSGQNTELVYEWKPAKNKTGFPVEIAEAIEEVLGVPAESWFDIKSILKDTNRIKR